MDDSLATVSVSAVKTTRIIGSARIEEQEQPQPNSYADNELDSNADTCCLGANFVILSYTGRTADVYPYEKSYAPIANIPIVSGATAYDDPITSQTYLLIFNESLYYGMRLDHSLWNPNQIRANGVPLWDNPYDKTRELNIEILEDINIPLHTRGTKVLNATRSPTEHELQTCIQIEMTSPHPWEPGTVTLGAVSTIPQEYNAPKPDDDLVYSVNPSLVHLGERLISQIRVSYRNYVIKSMGTQDGQVTHENLPARRTFISQERHERATADTLAERFCIGYEQAKATLAATQQRGVRSAILPLSRRYRADRMYSVKRLNGKFATDTLWATVRSLRQNICAQVYSHKCGFQAAYVMTAATGDTTGHSLLDFIHDFGAPEHLTFDGASVHVGPKTLFMKTVRRSRITTHTSEAKRANDSPAEAAIREIKKRWYRIMQKMRVPQRLWDFGLVWICETGNFIVSSSRYANGRSALEIITGETPDITEYLDFSFYGWCMHRTNAGLGESFIGRWL